MLFLSTPTVTCLFVQSENHQSYKKDRFHLLRGASL